jgi:hypothetical protein
MGSGRVRGRGAGGAVGGELVRGAAEVARGGWRRGGFGGGGGDGGGGGGGGGVGDVGWQWGARLRLRLVVAVHARLGVEESDSPRRYRARGEKESGVR